MIKSVATFSLFAALLCCACTTGQSTPATQAALGSSCFYTCLETPKSIALAAEIQTPSRLRDLWNRATQPLWCDGLCEIYLAQMAEFTRNPDPAADRQELGAISRTARQLLHDGRMSEVHNEVWRLRCAARAACVK